MKTKKKHWWKAVWTTERGQFDIAEKLKATTEGMAARKLYSKHGDICIRRIVRWKRNGVYESNN